MSLSLGIKSVLLFGIPTEKDECGTGAYHDHGIVQEATRFIKEKLSRNHCRCRYLSYVNTQTMVIVV